MRLVSVIIPCRNEIRYIQPFLESLLSQEVDAEVECEFLIAEGMSDDGTRDILAAWQPRFKRLTIIDNEARTVPIGLNKAIRRARGEVIIRMDVHSEYATDYVQQCLAALDRHQADNVGGPAVARGTTYLQRAIALAHQSRFGCGGARFHDPSYEGYVDTVMYGCWRKSKLEELGLFDEELVRNQDDELNLRLTRQGGKIWQTPLIRLWYSPRSSLQGLARQYAQYGYWKVKVIRKHQIPASWRHLVPAAFAASLLILGIFANFSWWGRWLFAVLLGTYLLASIGASLLACRSPKNWWLIPEMPVVFAVYHFSYGIGFLFGLWDLAVNRKPAATFAAFNR